MNHKNITQAYLKLSLYKKPVNTGKGLNFFNSQKDRLPGFFFCSNSRRFYNLNTFVVYKRINNPERVRRLNKRGVNNWEAVSKDTAKLKTNLQISFKQPSDLLDVGTVEIFDIFKNANSALPKSEQLTLNELKQAVLDLIELLGSVHHWYSVYLLKDNTDFLNITTKQHKKLATKFYTSSVLVLQTFKLMYPEKEDRERLGLIEENKIRISDDELSKILKGEIPGDLLSLNTASNFEDF